MVDISSQNNKINVTVSSSGNTANTNVTPDYAQYYSEKSKEWAISNRVVDNTDYSSKYYANESKKQADISTAKATEVVESGNTAISNIESARDNAIIDVNTAGATQVALATEQANIATNKASEVVASGNNALTNIDTAKDNAIISITNQETTSKNVLIDEGATQIELIQNEGAKQVANVQSTGFYMRDDKLYFINSQGEETEFKPGGASIPYGTEIALASTIEYVPVGFLPTDGTEYSASDFQKLWDDYIVCDVWTLQTVGNTSYHAITYANNMFVAVSSYGKISTSPDGINWNTQTVSSDNYYAIIYANNIFVAVGISGQISTSSNGINWNTQTVGSDTYTEITYANNIFIAVGYNGKISTSTDGINWNTQTVGSNDYYAITYANNMFVVVGYNGKISTSTDGINWTEQTVGSTSYHAITYANNMFVAVGGKGQISTSTDGINWNTQTVGSNAYKAITYANNTFVAVGGYGQISTSTDGINWTEQTVGSNAYKAITYANNIFVAVGDKGQISTSTDGINWNTQTVGRNIYYAITYANSMFVAVGNITISILVLSYNKIIPFLSSLSYTDYATEISNYGQCSKFGIDTINNKFKVPTKLDKEYRYYIYVKDDNRTVDEWTAYVKSLGGNTTGFSDNQYAPRIKKTYQSGTSGYIIWSNGYCEQFGASSVSTSQTTITLTKTFKDTNYILTMTGMAGYPFIVSKSTKSFVADTSSNTTVNWIARGFLANGQY